MKKLLALLPLFALLIACSGNKEKGYVARVYDKTLLRADVSGVVPPGVHGRDSAEMIRGFINTWAENQLMLRQAENNLESEQKNFDKEIEAYKNSLIIYAYQKEFVRQKLDTQVTENEIRGYYNSHPQEFTLKDNIVQVRYIKLMKGTKGAALVKMLYRSDKRSDLEKLEKFCSRFAVNYFMDDSKWLYMRDLKKEIPIKSYDEEEFLKNNKSAEFQEGDFVYFVGIKGFRSKESLSPLTFERENIRSILLNKKKLKLIDRLKADILEQARNKNEVEINLQ
jgi:hypothetical protein